jgi:ferredoxin-NADP reductase
MDHIRLRIAAVRHETDSIRRIDLVDVSGAPLRAFDAGAHLTIDVPNVGLRKYSLVTLSSKTDAGRSPTAYVIGVRLERDGGGGSRFMHALAVGDVVTAHAPQNNFPLTAGTDPVALVGGGIGITPLMSMAAALRAAGRPFSMVYAARSRSELAFLPEITALAGDKLLIHTDDTAGHVFDMSAHFATLAADARVYMCGPKPMLKAGMDAAKRLQWPRNRLAFELFYSVAAAQAAPSLPEGTFEVVLKRSGKTFTVPPDKTILDVLIAAGEDPLHDCKRGDCGVCTVGVIEGIPDHKDSILSESEKAKNQSMQICISRAKSSKLVLDL